jgi:competence protein ComEA
MIKKLLAAVLALFAAAAFAAVDANKATQAELETVKGIGPAISTKIIEERKKAPFKDWNDMVERVKGVGDGNAAKFSTAGLSVNGAAFKGAPAAPAAAKKEEKPAAAPKADEKKAAAAMPAPAVAPTAAPVAAPMAKDDKAKPAAAKASDAKPK